MSMTGPGQRRQHVFREVEILLTNIIQRLEIFSGLNFWALIRNTRDDHRLCTRRLGQNSPDRMPQSIRFREAVVDRR